MSITTSAPPLRVELNKHNYARSRLLAEIPDLDAETFADTLEEITDLREMLAEVVRSALDDEALASGLSTRLSDMKARLERFEVRAKRKRQLALQAMTEADIPKLAEADFTASAQTERRRLRLSPRIRSLPRTGNRSRRSSTNKDCWRPLSRVSPSRASRIAATQTQLSVRTR